MSIHGPRAFAGGCQPRAAKAPEPLVPSHPRQRLAGARPLWLATLVVCGLLASCGQDGHLPELPRVDTAGFLPAVQEKLRQTADQARRSPNDAHAVGRYGMALHAHEQYANAELAYLRATALEPNSLPWKYYLALVRQALGNREAALKAVSLALTLDPKFRAGRHLKAELLTDLGLLPEATAILQELLRENPRDALAHYRMGRVYQGRDQLPEAIASFQKACEHFPSFGAAHFALAGLHRQQGERNQAARHLRAYELYKSISAPLDDPLWESVSALNMSPQAHLRRAIQLESAGRLAEAAVANDMALQLDPALVQAHVNLVSLHGRLGNLDKAFSHFRDGLKLNPNRDDLYYNYGVLLFQVGKFQDSKIAFERALAINPYHGDAQTNLGYLLQTEGRVKESVGMLEKAVQNAPQSRLAHFHLARALIHLGRLRDAVSHFEQTLQPEDEQTPTYLYALSAAHARLRNRKEALAFAYKAQTMATERGQTALLESINRDIPRMEAMHP